MSIRFQTRQEAGKELARLLDRFIGRPGLLVLGLPRGGIPVAFEVAKRLNGELDVFCVRKLGLSGHEEFAIGAIASGGLQVLNGRLVESFRLSDADIEAVAARARVELDRQERVYRGSRPALELRNRFIILVDDGIAIGSTMRAAICAVRQQEPEYLVVATPVAALEAARLLRREADEFVAVITPRFLGGVGQWYEDFTATSDEEVRQCLNLARQFNPSLADEIAI